MVEYVRGAERLAQRIKTVRNNLNLDDITAEVGQLILKRTLERFDRGVDPDENAWLPLKDSTLLQKRRLGFDEGPLKRSLRLRDSIGIIRGGSGSFASNTGAGVRIGVQDPAIAEYARYLNNGTAGKNRLPPRRFLGIGRLDVKAVDSLMRRRADKVTQDWNQS